MLHVTGGQVIAVLFTCLLTIFGIAFYYFYERKACKAIRKTKNQKLTKKNISKIEQDPQKSIKRKLNKRPTQILLNPHILTTEEAAHLLKISRPHLVQLLEEGKMPCRKIGTSRRIKLQDILSFKKNTVKNWSKINELDILFSYVFLKYL